MDSKELKELMEYISQSNFVEFEIELEDFKLKLVKDSGRLRDGSHNHNAGGGLMPQPVQPAAGYAAPPSVAAAAPAAAPAADIYQVTSPMVGTFYRTPNPSAAPFVQVGDIVKKGQALCIIEAMKLMNEIESEVAGEVVDIPVSNGQPVEYGEVLFRIRVISS
ncbi:MAG TPA: acetyl-CoA carboxylase biotin carboxyl carrier protein [Patescibacteria group bacterium]|nr:acetyl-CoA carboxylase biotin carboxyl carrier protein [Patescibacteria group bacterium]